MYYDHFLILLALNWPWYVLFLVLSTLTLVPFLRRHTLGWFDPLSYIVVFAMLANAIPPFLWVVDQMSTEMLVFFICSETAFWLGLSLYAGKRCLPSDVRLSGESHFAYYFFLICFTLYVALTLLSYAMFGIPLFLDTSRLSVYEGSGGFGILQRFNNFFSVFSIFYAFHLIQENTHKKLGYLCLAVAAVFLCLTGSKGAFLYLLYAYFGYALYYRRRAPKTSRRIILYLGIGAFCALFIMSFQVLRQQGEIIDSVGSLAVRFIGSGDCYFYAYPNDIYKGVDVGNSFAYLFQGVLAPMRLLSPDDTPPAIGVQLAWLARPSSIGMNLGPNARMPIFSYILFGWCGIIFSYVGGCFTSFLLYRLPKYLPNSIIFCGFATYAYIMATSYITDFGLGIANLFDVLLNLGFTIVVVYVLTAMTTGNRPHTSLLRHPN